MKKTMRKAISMLLLIMMVVTMLSENMFGQENGMVTKVKAVTTAEKTIDKEQNEPEHAMGDETTRWTVGEDTNALRRHARKDTASVLPASVDNSQTKYFPKVGNQGSVGSCVCWAEVYYNFTYTLCKARDVEATGKNVMSPIFIYNKIRLNGPTLGVSGSSSGDAARLLKSIGTPSYDLATGAQDNTYLTWFPTEEIWKNAAQNRLSSYTKISNPLGQITSPKDSDLDLLKQYLADGKLISYSTSDPNYGHGWTYKTIPSGSPFAAESICTEARTDASGSHRMVIVGYNDNIYVDINGDGVIQEAEKGAFKVANSWGTSYRNKGFCWVSYDALNKKSAVLPEDSAREEVFYSMSVMDVEDGDNASDLNLKVTLNTQKRCQIVMTITAEDADGKVINYRVDPFDRNNWGAVSLDGKTTATDGTVLIGLDNVISDITASKVNDYIWTVTVKDARNDGNPVIIKELSFRDASGNSLYTADVNNYAVDGDTYTWSVGGNPVELTPSIPSGKATETQNIVFTAKAANPENLEYQFLIDEVVKRDFSSEPSFTWKSEYRKEGHKIKVKVKNVKLDKVVSTKVIDYEVLDALGVNITPSIPSGKVTETQNVTFTATAKDTKNLQYQFLVDGTVMREYSTSPSFVWKSAHSYSGHTIVVNVKNTVTGKIIMKKIAYTVNRMPSFTGFTIGTASPKVGDTLTVIVSGMNGTGTLTKRIEVQPEGGTKTTIFEGPLSAKSTWTPTKAGKYTLHFTLIDENNFSVSQTMNCVVSGSENTVNVYYANSSYNTAYIHYKVGNGAWTTVPGVKMNTSSEKSGYTWKYTIDLGSESEAVVCFNNGNGAWDSKNGSNYLVYAGDYGIKNEQVTKLGAVDTMNQATVYYANSAWNNAYIHYKVGNGEWTTVPGVKMNTSSEKSGYTWKYTIDLGSESEAVVCFNNGNGAWDSKNGSNYLVYAGDYGIKNGQVTKLGAVDTLNQTTIYYANSAWNNAYIHYKVGNGEWTTVPGVKMNTSSEKSGYTWKYTIDLGSESNATVCFNNGNGSWDSRNGANYTLSAGTYGIKNQQVVNPDSNNNAVSSISAVGLEENMASDMAVAESMGTAYRFLMCINNMKQFQN